MVKKQIWPDSHRLFSLLCSLTIGLGITHIAAARILPPGPHRPAGRHFAHDAGAGVVHFCLLPPDCQSG